MDVSPALPARTLLTTLLLAAFLAAPALPAVADNTADEAELRFNRGVAFYRDRRYEDALAEFFHSNRLVRNRNVIHNIARCYERLGRFDEAYRYYTDVLAEDPTDADREAVAESLARLAPRVALLHVETEPPGAEVFIERVDLGSRGQTPRTLALPAGEATVILALAGHREVTTEATLQTGRIERLEVPLEFIWGHLRIEGPPDGAEVRLDRTDGELLGTLPGPLPIRPGRHILHVSAEGHVAVQVPVEVAGDESQSLALELPPLPPPTGTLVVTANRDGALVRIDGREVGFTPAVLTLPVGRHEVTVTMPDMRTHGEVVELEEDGRVIVQAELRFTGGTTTAASKIETPVEEAPASITVITREEIRAFGYTSLPEALRGIRGLFVSNDRTYEYVGVRGFSPPGDLNSRILILYDGHAMNDVWAGHAYLGRENTLDLEDVERIEIVRGPVSSLFGSAAFLGVINIVPRERSEAWTADLTGGAGSLGLGRARGTFGHRTENAEIAVSLGALTARGEEVFFLPAQGALPEVAIRNRDGEQVYTGTLRARTGDLTLLGSFNSRNKDVPTGAYYTLLEEPGMDIRDQRGFFEARWQRSMGRASVGARAYYDATRYRGTFLDEDGEQIDRAGADWIGTELRYRSPEWLRQHLTLGLEYQAQLNVFQRVFYDGELELDDRHTFHIASAYLVDELRLTDWFLVNASVRFDHYLDSFGPTLNPRVGVIMSPYAGGVTKLMGGRSFRAPTTYERFYEDGPLDPVSGARDFRSARANPDLGPEIIHTAELEHTQQLGDEVQLVGSLFVNRISDLIVEVADPGEEFTYRINAPSLVRTEGAEVEVRWRPGRLSMLSAAYWFQRMHVGGLNDPDEEARLRSNAPAHAFALRGMFPISAPMIVGSAEAIYNSARLTHDGHLTGEFLLLNAGLSGELPGSRFRYFAGVQNLLDERVQLPVGAEVPRSTVPSLGRTFHLELGITY
jgi:outer membrane receptor for ferrienterochelin and colicins